MHKAQLLAVLLLGACASDVTEEPEVEVEAAAEALSCATDSAVCSAQKYAAENIMGGGHGNWHWSGSCSPGAIWNATGPGGRTCQAIAGQNTASLNTRVYNPSQMNSFTISCRCQNGAIFCF